MIHGISRATCNLRGQQWKTEHRSTAMPQAMSGGSCRSDVWKDERQKKCNPISVDENWKLNARTSLKKERARDLASAREEDANGAAAGALRIAAWPAPRTAAKALILVFWPPVRPPEAARAGLRARPGPYASGQADGPPEKPCHRFLREPCKRWPCDEKPERVNGGVTGYGG